MLLAHLQGKVSLSKRVKAKRTNWDTPENQAIRERIRVSWETKTDLYKDGDSFAHFCVRNAINRHVLLRYIARVKSNTTSKKRGRKPLLSEDVMKHICEGNIVCVLLVYVKVIFFYCVCHVMTLR